MRYEDEHQSYEDGYADQLADDYDSRLADKNGGYQQGADAAAQDAREGTPGLRRTPVSCGACDRLLESAGPTVLNAQWRTLDGSTWCRLSAGGHAPA